MPNSGFHLYLGTENKKKESGIKKVYPGDTNGICDILFIKLL